MYSYTNKNKVSRRKLIVTLASVLVVAVAFLSYEYTIKQSADTPVFKEDSIPVLNLPSTPDVEKGRKPFKVEAMVALDYFDGKEETTDSITKFEGIYRANQGMDYTSKDEAFDIIACFSGKISEVKDDSIFGKTVTITSDDLKITYQSLQGVNVKKDDEVKQGDVIGKAGSNIYNKDLGNHLHIVCEKAGKIIDPESIFDKSIEEIK